MLLCCRQHLASFWQQHLHLQPLLTLLLQHGCCVCGNAPCRQDTRHRARNCCYRTHQCEQQLRQCSPASTRRRQH